MKAIIYGAGKISRGFISQLVYLAGYDIVYVDINDSLLAQLSTRKQFTVHVMGASEKNTLITGFKCLSLTDTAAVARELQAADIVFTSVGGKNLPSLGATIAAAFTEVFDGGGPKGFLNIITCENWKDPARVLAESIRGHLSDDRAKRFDTCIGVAQAVVMRSAVDATPDILKQDPLTVPVQDFWQLPVDIDSIKGQPPAIPGIIYQENFAGFLERKIYTYNTGNATIAYLGYLKKSYALADAANDDFIVAVLDQVYQQTNKALSLKHKCSLEEQTAFSEQAKRKYQDYAIIDDVRRHANDPIRKLGPDDRLIGAARLVQAYHLPVDGISIAIAAALYYDNPQDALAVSLQALREQRGIDHVLQTVCQISLDGDLAKTIKAKIVYLKKIGLIDHE
ncbi:Mannitol-1-phosphate 5-dehydrogenase [Sodalis praecaptivus]|uniref:Mannitol-1-phosphate 5-dehydrogenase n=1 Tax=Sodalis praecaptivus TaxID=1239307 RepID=W0HVX4_9GAMM|nr:hypothetical protein [Sodalis praecaptivus]AHF76672.1 Mannitol-1-phosphate 5-dehydrogenase [Sodalis praecaptivus]